ncbi:MAG: PHP domain-containing protein [Chloroflexia bacterium]
MSLFTYLHIHTHFSLGGGPASPEKWCRQASAFGYKAIGIADRAPLAGFPRFETAARSNGLTPVFGVEIDLLLPGSSKSSPLAQPALLFACDHDGLSNLGRVCSLAYGGWPGVEAGVPVDTLIAHTNGLVVILLGGDEAGALAPLMSLMPKKRNEIGNLLRESFGERAFLGVPHSGRSGDGMLAGQVVRAAEEMGLPPVALPTARYLDAADALSYEALRLARQKAGWPRPGTPTPLTTHRSSLTGHWSLVTGHWLRPPDEAAALFAEWPEAVENVARIVEICSGANRLTIGTEHAQGEDAISLAQVAERKLSDIAGVDELSQAAKERLQAEVTVCEQSGRVGSWLALASLRELASQGIQTSERTQVTTVPLGAALGMAEGSLLAYAFGLFSLDPLPYAAPRWLANSSQSVPLPGIEVPASKREALVSALSKEYGPSRTAYAACATDITPNAAISAVATVLGMPKEGVRELAGVGQWGLLREREAEEQDQKLSRIAALACSLEGAPVTFKPDYSTLLTAPRSMFADSVIGDWLPVMSYQSGQSGKAWVPWCEEALCKLGYPALSIQPSYILSALEAGLSLAARYPTSGFSVDNIDLTKYPQITEQTAQVITDGWLAGIPYISHEALKSLQGEITPESMALLVARSLTGGISPGKEGITAWEEAASDTAGLLIYKDQLDMLLSSIAEQEPDDIATMRSDLRERSDDARARFTATCQGSGIDTDSAEGLWAALSAASSALISRSSAQAWGRVALWSAMLKAHHPATLLAGALDATWERGARDQLLPLVEEAQRLDISVRPPDVDRSHSKFGLERNGTGWAIMWCLARLPGWNMDVADRFLGVRPAGGFSNFEELVRLAMRVGLTQAHIETLLRAGGCDRLGGIEHSRYGLLEVLPVIIEHKHSGLSGPIDMFTTDHNEIQNPNTRKRVPEIQNEEGPTPRERYLQRSWEMKNLGMWFTLAPEIDNLRRALESSGDLKARLLSTTQVGPKHIGQSVSLVGLLTSPSFIKGATGDAGNGNSQLPDDPGAALPNTMSVAWIEDVEGSIELIAFPPNYKRYREQWTENSLVIVTGRVSTHENDDIYLLCEQIAPFYAEAVEEGFSIKVKAHARGALRKGAGKSTEPGPTSEGEIVASVVAPHTTPLHAGNGSQPTPPLGGSNAVATKEISSPTYSLIITLPEADNDNAAIDGMNTLKRLLSQHPGADTVSLRIPYSPDTGSVTSAQLPYGVQYSHSLESEIAHLFGPAALAVIEL